MQVLTLKVDVEIINPTPSITIPPFKTFIVSLILYPVLPTVYILLCGPRLLTRELNRGDKVCKMSRNWTQNVT